MGAALHVFMPMGDHLGSSSFVIDHDTSEVVEAMTYQLYGGVEADYRPRQWQGFREDVRYTGHWDDSQVGLVYFGARYYAPQLARWISPDPLTVHGFAGDPNPYAFVGGSPMSYVDPFGLDVDNGSSYPGGGTINGATAQIGLTISGYVSQAPAANGYGSSDSGHYQSEPGEGQSPDATAAADENAGVSGTSASGESSGAPGTSGGSSPTAGGGSPGGGPGAFPGVGGTDNPVQPAGPSLPERVLISGLETVTSLLGPENTANAVTSPNQRAVPAVTDGEVLASLTIAAVASKVGGSLLGAAAEDAPFLARFNAGRASHIFRDAAGHVNPASAGSQARFVALFSRVASSSANLRGDAVAAGIITQDAANAGVQAFTWTARSGEQVWVTVLNGEIQNAGVNAVGAIR